MSRYIIWIVVVSTFLAIGYLCMESLAFHFRISRWQKELPSQSSRTLIDDIALVIGPSKVKLRLSAQSWPAVVTLCSMLGVCVGMFFLLPGRPEKFERDGLSRIGDYVNRVFQSHKERASVVITQPGGDHAVLLTRMGKEVLVAVFHTPGQGAIEFRTKLTNFFASHGIMRTSQFDSSPIGQEDNPCAFAAVLSPDPKAITRLIQALCTDLFDGKDSMGLEFRTRF